ncbi:PQQ-dependent sugar dehydrogenase [Yinghuangia soli]|uniref:PQQ-dependent sugar dehydrogenase n=1 Tax=Yinghuangia soli TaxID=2908204 RepID=A0AA41Q0Z4_9ACTN|nr:PQQ-dependent sugar dehydrogenase [Yinghuangia soli]MCF2529553.1 PQQ-dependent sugar dehydrogenase [Yinghuangia soli]
MGIVLTLTAGLFWYTLAERGEAAQTLPPGFSVRESTTGQQGLTTDFVFTPDGGYITIGKSGHVAYVSAGGQVTPLKDIPVDDTLDLGLTGMALAPDFATNRTMYTAYTTTDGKLRLSRWKVDGQSAPTGLSDEFVMVEAPARFTAHAITGVLADADGYVWLSIGDNADFVPVDPRALDAQKPDSPYGKLMRLDNQGRGVPGNPGYNAAAPDSWASRMYASGFRSPFRLSLDPVTGAPLVGDVGWGTWEEIDLVRAGDNYGWPCWEGDFPTAGYTDLPGCKGVAASKPLYAYNHDGKGASVTGGVVYTGISYPEQYRNSYFFGDYSQRMIRTMKIRDAQGAQLANPVAEVFSHDPNTDWRSTSTGPAKFAAAPGNGDIVYVDLYTNSVKRLVYEAGNRAPVAKATTTVDPAQLTVTFDASDSNDLDGDPLTYAWDFGDGESGTGPVVTHKYEEPGDYEATVTVTDTGGKTGTYKVKVVPANHAPKIEWTAPAADRKFKVGEKVRIEAQATDTEDGALNLRWEVVMAHCYGGTCHAHNDSGHEGGTFDRAFPDHGDDTHMQLTAIATDSKGVTTQRVYAAWPKLVTLTVKADTPVTVTLNSHQAASVPVVVGSKVTMTAPETATDGVATFARWGDDETERAREAVMPDHDWELTLDYATPIDKRLAAEPAVAALLGAPTGPEVGDADLRSREFAKGRAYWSRAAGVHVIRGELLANYLAQGGAANFGPPTTDELTAPDGVGKYHQFGPGASAYWSPRTGSHMVWGAIHAKWRALGGEGGSLGYPATDEGNTGRPGGRYNNFEKGSITWSATTGAHAVSGAFGAKYAQYGWDAGILGFPVSDEAPTGRPGGRYINFQNGVIIVSDVGGARAVYGGIFTKWGQTGWDGGYLGFPLTDEANTGRPGGRYAVFQGGTIYWSAQTGPQVVMGAIAQKYAEYNWDSGGLGFPTTSEASTRNGAARFNHFQGGAIYWSPQTGAHAIYGGIRVRWDAKGAETSYLGLPTSEEYSVNGGRRQDFQFGYIVWTPANGGTLTDRRY